MNINRTETGDQVILSNKDREEAISKMELRWFSVQKEVANPQGDFIRIDGSYSFTGPGEIKVFQLDRRDKTHTGELALSFRLGEEGMSQSVRERIVKEAVDKCAGLISQGKTFDEIKTELTTTTP